jgi:uncharacterized membrane protein
MVRFGFNARWVFFPVLYAAGTLPVLAVGVFVADRVARTALGCHWCCEVAGLLALLVAGALVFVLSSMLLTRLERLRAPKALDHVRHCMWLYMGLVVLGITLVASYDTLGLSLGYGLGVALFFVAVYAILLNALVVFAMRRRFSVRSS